jgi:PAS domain S-box-containing protein
LAENRRNDRRGFGVFAQVRPPLANLRAVLHAALDCVVAIDGMGRVIEFNPAAERTFGYTAEEAIGREMVELIVPPSLRERHRTGFARYLAGGAPVVLERRIEITGMRASGEEFPVELTITRARLDGPPVFVGYLRDITDRRRAEAELRDSRARIVVAADEARRRIERDLHDGIQQQLIALAVALGRARASREVEPLDDAIAQLAAITTELREIARGIHPVVLTEEGLDAALTGLAGRSSSPRCRRASCRRSSRRPPTSSSPKR